jgi:hypothetical protein
MNNDLNSLFEDLNDEQELKSTQQTKKENSKAKNSMKSDTKEKMLFRHVKIT